MVFYNPEPNYWMVMVRPWCAARRLVAGPIRSCSPPAPGTLLGTGPQYIDQASVRRPSKDDREVVEYLDHDLQDSVLDATIRQVYKMFKVRALCESGVPKWRPPATLHDS